MSKNQKNTTVYTLVLGAAILVLAPVASIFSSWLSVSESFWDHIFATFFYEYLSNTLLLAITVVIISCALGTFLALVTTYVDFPGRKIISGLSYCTLVFPPYVLGFILLGMFEYSGPLMSSLRNLLGFDPQFIPTLSGFFGASISLSVSLFPYVYMLTKLAFNSRGYKIIEASKSLGLNFNQSITRLIFPLAAPAVFGGGIIVLMEVMADFGTVAVFGYDTFTTGIYKAWFSFFDLSSACQLASVLLLFMTSLYYLKVYFQKEDEVYPDQVNQGLRLESVSVWLRWTISISCFSFFALFLLAPVVQLVVWCVEIGFLNGFELVENNLLVTIFIGAVTSIAITTYSIILLELVRPIKSIPRVLKNLMHLPSIGYAFPGAVLAAGYVTFFANFDLLVDAVGIETSMVLSGSLLMLFIGLFIRFYAVGFSVVTGSYARISKSLDEAANGFGIRGFKLFREIRFPILKKSFLGAIFICFIDVVKEMPLTLMTRPMGWDTLSVKIFEWTAEGEWEKAAIPSLILVILGCVSLWLMVRLESSRASIGGEK